VVNKDEVNPILLNLFKETTWGLPWKQILQTKSVILLLNTVYGPVPLRSFIGSRCVHRDDVSAEKWQTCLPSHQMIIMLPLLPLTAWSMKHCTSFPSTHWILCPQSLGAAAASSACHLGPTRSRGRACGMNGVVLAGVP